MSDAALRLAHAGLAPRRVASLLSEHGSPEGVVEALLAGRARATTSMRAAVGVDGDQRRRRLASLGAVFVARGHTGYPPRLELVPDPPLGLFVAGRLPAGRTVAVVGSRAATRYGIGLAEGFGRVIAESGRVTVSGLARGVDGAAHRGTRAAGGVGLAVLGSGIDVWYPAEHRTLGRDLIASGGGVISEYPPGTPPEPWRFPCRNRLIAGLTDVLVVVEAAASSGALITARTALELGVDVLAVPGDVDRPTSVGTNLLIRDGALPVLGSADLLEALRLILGAGPVAAPLGPVDPCDGVLGLVGTGGVSLENLALALGDAGRAAAELGRLEAAGAVVVEGGVVRRNGW